MSDVPRIRVAALVLLEGRVVLVRHRAGASTYHLLPGGGVDYRETLRDAVIREFREETGLDIEVGRPLLLNDTIDPSGKRHVVNVTFAGDVIGGELADVSSDPRVEAIELVDPSELDSLDLRPPFADALMRHIEDQTAPCEYLGSLFRP